MSGLIVCGTCKEELPPERFAKCKNNLRTGRQWSCRACKADQAKMYNGRYDRKAISRRHRLKKKYGLTSKEWDRMFQEQGGKCAICEGDCSTGRNLAVDHCHTTGAVRGLLCMKCNQGIGYFDDDERKLQSAIFYLRREYGV